MRASAQHSEFPLTTGQAGVFVVCIVVWTSSFPIWNRIQTAFRTWTAIGPEVLALPKEVTWTLLASM